MQPALSRYVEAVDAPGGGATLLYSARTGKLVVASADVWRDLRVGEYSRLTSEVRELLVEAEILTADAADEPALLAARSESAARTPRTLARILLPSSYCQLECGYCGQEHTYGVMNRPLMDRVTDDVKVAMSQSEFTELYVTWFGGEPTTAPHVIEYLSKRFVTLCRAARVRYRSRLITNGLALSLRLAKRLVMDCNVSQFVVSLDGPATVHDERRPTKSGRGSYATIIRNLSAIVQSIPDVSLKIRVNVGPENAPSVHGLIEELSHLGFAPRVDVEFAPVVPWSPNPRLQEENRREMSHREVAWFGHLMARGFRLNVLPKPRPSPCLAAEPSSVVVSTDGSVHNCTLTPLAGHAVTASIPVLGELGSRESGLAEHHAIFDRLNSVDVPCRACSVRFLCQGACPREMDLGIVPCPTFKFNLPARMRLHYLEASLRRARTYATPRVRADGQLPDQTLELIKASLSVHIDAFRERFPLFRMPASVWVSVDADVPAPASGQTDGCVHRLLPVDAYRKGLCIHILKELAKSYLGQLNAEVLHDGRIAVQQIAEDFAEWAASRCLQEPPPAAGSPIASLSQRCWVEAMVKQPVDAVIAWWTGWQRVHSAPLASTDALGRTVLRVVG